MPGPPGSPFEQLVEIIFSLAAHGKTNRRGLPNPLRLVVIAKVHFDDVRLPCPAAGSPVIAALLIIVVASCVLRYDG